jgi:Na+/H+ antiporter NhaC
MFQSIRTWIYGAIAALLTFGAAFLYRKGRNDVRDEITENRLEAIKEKQDVEKEIETQDDDHLVDLISKRD